MKKNVMIWAMSALVFASCGTTKTTTAVGSSVTSSEEGQEIAMTACEKFAEELPGLRFAASGDSWDINRSRMAAEAAARNQLASAIASKCENAYLSGGADYTQTATTELETKRMTDGNDVTNAFFKSAASMVVKDAPVVKSQRFKLKNGNYRTWVCVELRQGLYNIANEIATKVEQQISDEERLKMKYDRDKFVKQIQDEMKKGY
jgi:hypothetical protein